jgi:hypothetical protein
VSSSNAQTPKRTNKTLKRRRTIDEEEEDNELRRQQIKADTQLKTLLAFKTQLEIRQLQISMGLEPIDPPIVVNVEHF